LRLSVNIGCLGQVVCFTSCITSLITELHYREMNLADDIDKNLPDWDDQAKKSFNEFKKRRRSLPSPSDVDNNSMSISKRQRGRENEISKRAVKRSNIVDINRRILSDCADVSMDADFKSSTISENFMSLDNTDNDLDQTEVICDNIEKDLASSLELIKNRADVYEILEKIVNNLSQSYKKMRELVCKVNNDCAQGRIQGGVLGVKTPTLFGKFFQFARVF